jgi:hypothetical protein
MLSTTRKKRLPIEQLTAAADNARAMLITKRFEHKEGIIEQIVKNADSPILPGMPPYIPHRHVLDSVVSAVSTLAHQWAKKHTGDSEAQESFIDFVRFAIKEFEAQERKYKKEVRLERERIEGKGTEMDYSIHRSFGAYRRLTSATAIKKFIVDSFSTSVVVHQNETVSQYLEWFLEWIPKLAELTPKPWKTGNKKE